MNSFVRLALRATPTVPMRVRVVPTTTTTTTAPMAAAAQPQQSVAQVTGDKKLSQNETCCLPRNEGTAHEAAHANRTKIDLHSLSAPKPLGMAIVSSSARLTRESARESTERNQNQQEPTGAIISSGW
jgi:hypothetical protein